MRRVLLLVFIVFLGLISSRGQEAKPEGKKWTLKECVDIALENNLRIKRSFYNVETFKANMLQSKGAFLPTVNVGGTYAQNYGRALNPVTNLYADRNSDNINVQGTGSLNLLNGLRIQNNYKSSQRDLLAADQDLQKAKNDVVLNVVTTFTNVIFNQELLENARYQLTSSQGVLERITKQVSAGSLAMTNQLNQEAQVATNEVNVINQENALNLSVLQLKQAMQIPAAEILVVEIPELQLEDLVLEQNAEGVYGIALNTMPEIRSAMLKVESANYVLKANKGNYYPRLSFNASIQSNYSSLSNVPQFASDPLSAPIIGTRPIGVTASNDFVYSYAPFGSVMTSSSYGQLDQIQNNLFKAISLQLSIPILNGFQTRASVQRASINKQVADITVKETQNTLRQSIETAYNDAFSASRSYTASLKQVNAQQEAYRMNKQRFEVGALNIIEYQVSENDLFRAKSDLTRAKYNFIFKKKILDFYQGKPIEY